MDDTLRLSRGVLYTQDGPIKVKRIGKGAFSVAMASLDVNPRTGERDVFLFSDDDTSDKELLSMAHDADERNPHIPKVEKLGYTHDKTVYVMPLYKSPLRKGDDPKGWKDYLAVKKCLDTAIRSLGHEASGYDINFATLECAREAGVRQSVADALETLVDTAANYGDAYQFEFSPRNLATDARGNLVLLDVLFDKEALLRRRKALYERAQATRFRNPSRRAKPARGDRR